MDKKPDIGDINKSGNYPFISQNGLQVEHALNKPPLKPDYIIFSCDL